MCPQGKICSYPILENPRGLCGKKLYGRQKKFCTEHSKIHRTEYKRARGADDVKAWRTRHPEQAGFCNQINQSRRRMHLTRRDLLAGVVSAVGTAVFRPAAADGTEGHEVIWDQLQTMRRALAEDDAAVAPRIAMQAHQLCKKLER